MKALIIIQLARALFLVPLLVFFQVFLPQHTWAQDSGSPQPSENYSKEELSQMLAPIALYPDALLSQVLMASTYPIEVIEADRWVKRNPDLTGEALDAALLDKDWDPSVKSICHFPSILALMSERASETTRLGNAFLAQAEEVMDTVQELRAKAYAQGNLISTHQQKVFPEKEAIIIEPADPRFIYVPYYDPFHVYGPWWYPAYPPYYWGPPGVSFGVGISFWPGFHLAFSTWSNFDWHRRYIYIDGYKRPKYVRHDWWRAEPGRWHHAPRHRRGVAYRDKTTARKFGQYPRNIRQFRRDTRGFPEHQDRLQHRSSTDKAFIKLDNRKIQRTKIDRPKPQQPPIERNRQQSFRKVQKRKEQERAQSAQQRRTHENIFNQIEDGREERQSSKRGRVSRQGRVDHFRGKGRTDGYDRGDRGWKRK